MEHQGEIILYQPEEAVCLEVRLEDETIVNGKKEPDTSTPEPNSDEMPLCKSKIGVWVMLGFVVATLIVAGIVYIIQQQSSVTKLYIPAIEMVAVSGGTFTMGGDGYTPHVVTLDSYYIGKYEVTQAQWKAVMGSNPSHFTGDNLPVEMVSWDDIQVFINKLNAQTGRNYRLPTEVEWEFAAKGGTISKDYTYSGSNTIDNVAWYWNNAEGKTHPIGTKFPNELGIYDMSGNVWEWCQAWYDNEQTYRVLRGGSWINGAGDCLSTYRGGDFPGRDSYNGLRLALSL